MSNQFGIPDDIERKLRERDELCVYCGRKMKAYPLLREGIKDRATIEHFNWNGPFHWKDGLKEEDLAICCNTCNSSRGVKTLPDWFKGAYCTSRNINEATVAEPVKRYLAKRRPELST